MAPPVYRIVLLLPDEDEVALMAELSRDPLGEVVGVLDPGGRALGTAIAEILKLPVAADPADPRIADADYLVYPSGRADAEALLEQARRAGHNPLPTAHFRRLLCPPMLRREAAVPPPELESLDLEASEVDRTLSRVEEALDRESLLRWLLGAALRAVHASGGSLMLHDEKAGELYVAIAHGLSEGTLHTCRQRIGEGIAGRVAQRREGELLVGRPGRSGPRDRPEIESAICIPLVSEGKLLGVLNASTSSGERRLRRRDLEALQGLAPRLAHLLQGMVTMAERRLQQQAQQLERRLLELATGSDDLPATLGAWAGALAEDTRAERFSLAAICADGTLLVADAARGAAPAATARHDSRPNAAVQQVRRSGRPLVVRQREVGPGEVPITAFYLPVGRNPVRAVAMAAFGSAAAAHGFQAAAGETVWVLQRTLPDLLDRTEQKDHLDRLSRLATVLSEVAGGGPPDGSGPALLAAAASHLTGAGQAVVVRTVAGDAALPLERSEADLPWLRHGGRLLEEARPDRWRVTLLSSGEDPQPGEACVLAVTASRTAAAPGLLLLRKARLHPLDGAVFTDFDGQLAARLAAPLPALLEDRVTPAVLAELPLPKAPAVASEAPPVAPPAPPAEAPAAAPRQAVNAAAISEQQATVLDLLRREMDRADRYHSAFALIALRPLPSGWGAAEGAAAAAALRARVRSSDTVLSLPDGVVLLLAPEDIQEVGRLERRAGVLLGESISVPPERIATAHVTHPGRREDPAALLKDLLRSLPAAL